MRNKDNHSSDCCLNRSGLVFLFRIAQYNSMLGISGSKWENHWNWNTGTGTIWKHHWNTGATVTAGNAGNAGTNWNPTGTKCKFYF